MSSPRQVLAAGCWPFRRLCPLPAFYQTLWTGLTSPRSVTTVLLVVLLVLPVVWAALLA
jgi:hypothetical protein